MFSKLCTVGFVACLSGIALAEKIPTVVRAPVDTAFVPVGFDDNDNAEIVLHGHFNSSCYKTGEVKVLVDELAKTVTLSPLALHYQDGFCLQMQVPFLQSVKIGIVQEGKYKVIVADQPDAKTESLVIGKTESANPDDYLYAPVRNVSIRKELISEKNSTKSTKASKSRSILTISGDYPYMFTGCMEIQKVRKYMSPGNVLVVLPIAEIVQGEKCEARGGNQKFEQQVVVDDPISGDLLIHVRTLNGDSLNYLEENF